MNQIEVQIMGQSYRLGCPPGGEARLLKAVERVDAAMCKIREAGKIKARDRIAVLAALNLAFDLTEPVGNGQDSVSAPALDTASGTADTAHAQALSNLLQRLDAALGEDGQLI